MEKFLFLLFIVCFCLGFSNCNNPARPGFSSSLNRGGEIGFKKEIYENINPNDAGCNRDFIDPNDMLNYVHSAKQMLPSEQKGCPGTNLLKGCENCASHMQRFVNLFLRATGLKDYVLTQFNSKQVNLNFIVNEDDLRVLQLFAESGKTDLSLVNEALTNILSTRGQIFKDNSYKFEEERTRNEDNVESSYFNTFLKPFLVILLRLPLDFPQYCIAVCVTAVFGVTLWQVVNSRSWKAATSSLIFLIFSSGFGWNWIKLYKIADAKRVSSSVLNNGDIGLPIYCQPDKMTWFQYLGYYFTYEKECEEYYKKVMIDPIIEVSPTIVLAETISTFIVHPADKLGMAVGNFVTGLLDAVPLPYKLFVVPVILIFVAVFVIIISIVLIGGRLKFRIPFSSFEIGSNPVQYRQERQFIEDIHSQGSSIDHQPRVPIAEKSIQESPNERTNKERIALFKRFKEIELSDNGSGDNIVKPKEITSNVSIVKIKSDDLDVQDVRTDNVSRSPEVHLHVHIPKCYGDSNSPCHEKDCSILSSKAKESDIESLKAVTNSKEDSEESENSEFEQINKTELANTESDSEIK